jgi:dephospho-CoA kinase
MNKDQLIVGITGTNGAGKGTVVEILKKKGFDYLSVGGYLLEEVKKSGWIDNRESQIRMANELRTKFGSGYIMEQLYNEAVSMGENVIIESIRNEGEIATLKAKGRFFLLAVNADRALRYKRIVKRGGSKYNVSFEEFYK